MKKIVFVFASVMMLAACAKATIDTPDIEVPTDDNVKEAAVTLTAIMPEFTSDTKASISEEGTFSWVDGENADQIAVRYVNGEEEEYVIFSCTNAATGEFTGEPSEGYSIATSGNIAFYPSDYRGTPSSYNGTAANAGKSFQMKATEIIGSTLQFQHDNALLKVTIKDIPSIANNIVIGNSEMASTVTISEGGDLTVMVPSIPSVADQLHIYVKKGNTVLYTKGTSKGVAIQKGYLYTHIPPLSVAPVAVYLKSSMTDWSENLSSTTGWDAMTLNNGVYEASLNSLGQQYATVYVNWNGNLIKMGPSDDQSTEESQVFIETSHAVKLSSLGAYSFSFNPVTSTFTFSKTSSTVDFYVFGTENDWSLTDTSIPFNEKTYDGKYYRIGQKGQYKIRYNTFEASSFGQNGASTSGSTGPNAFGPSDTGSSSVIINIPTDGSGVTYHYFNEDCQSSESHDGVYVKINNSNDGLPMVQDQYNKSLWTYTHTSSDTHYVTFWVDELWGTNSSLSTTEYNGVGATYNRYFNVDNWCIGPMTYLIVLNDHTGKIKYLRL